MLNITRIKTGDEMKLSPKNVPEVLRKLEERGHQAVFVGGCVRDSLLGRKPSDWDAATSALPAEVLGIFKKCLSTGIKHGTVTVLDYGRPVEVTTFRAESTYTDHRRPDSVVFGCSLEDDLARRDFTVNAMALDLRGNITDPFGGRTDLGRGLLRCVGEPERRFSEDALRMLRAVRFSAQLGFGIEPSALETIQRLSHLALGLSAERVRDELMKTLQSPRPRLAWQLVDIGLLDGFIGSGDPAAPRSIAASAPLCSRLARFCLGLESGAYIDSTEALLIRLRMDAASVKNTAAAVEILKSGSRDWKRLLRDYGVQAVLTAHPWSRGLRDVLSSGDCWNLRQLAVDGKQLADLGYSGPELGRALDGLLEHVIDHPADNREDILLGLLNKERCDMNG